MFSSYKYIQNNFAISFSRYPEIRRIANNFEDLLKEHFSDHYGQPQVIPVPDELDPEVPRLIFGSKHGFSKIIISQIGMSLNVTYSPHWQTEIQKGIDYIKERSQALYLLSSHLENLRINYCGLTTRVRIPIIDAETELFKRLSNNKIFQVNVEDDVNDINLRMTTILENKFFSNISIQNYRNWDVNKSINGIPRLSNKFSSGKGVEITVDFNDRYSYNEHNDYFSTPEIKEEIINKGIEQVEIIINKFQEG